MAHRNESKFKINNCIYTCWTSKTSQGFAHNCIITDAETGEELARTKVNYLNRTWESYRYQSAMKRAQSKLKDTWRGDNYPYYDFDNERPTEMY